jgi:GST-like protein
MVYKLFYWPTPNGKKVSILLEELGIKYQLIPVNIGKGGKPKSQLITEAWLIELWFWTRPLDQFTDDFLKINPNHRMPALVDTEPADGGPPLSVFESGAMLEYIADKEGRFLPKDPRKRAEVMQWVFWQMANQGPKLGEVSSARIRE